MDEASPLLQNAHVEGVNRLEDETRKDVLIIDFDPNGDSENPTEYSKAYKWSIVALLAFISFIVYVQYRLVMLSRNVNFVSERSHAFRLSQLPTES